jgi:hypothetical protein
MILLVGDLVLLALLDLAWGGAAVLHRLWTRQRARRATRQSTSPTQPRGTWGTRRRSGQRVGQSA